MLYGLISNKFDFFIMSSVANCILWCLYYLGLCGVSVRNDNLSASRHRRQGFKKWFHFGFLMEILDYLKVVGLESFFGLIQLLIGMRIGGFLINWNMVLLPIHIYSVLLCVMGVACLIAMKYTFFDKYGKNFLSQKLIFMMDVHIF